ncbi:MAG: hypothetical protein CML06_05460 [Pseudomonadales bacterium]|nr:hypothetical protein [Pseudomonadales bacterium]
MTENPSHLLHHSGHILPPPAAAERAVLESPGPALVLDLAAADALSAAQLAALGIWCGQQPVPVVGVGPYGSAARACVDVVAESDAELQRLLRNIQRFPQASLVLVQVLRAIVGMPPEQGLTVESLGYSTLQSGAEYRAWLHQHRARNPGGRRYPAPTPVSPRS